MEWETSYNSYFGHNSNEVGGLETLRPQYRRERPFVERAISRAASAPRRPERTPDGSVDRPISDRSPPNFLQCRRPSGRLLLFHGVYGCSRRL